MTEPKYYQVDINFLIRDEVAFFDVFISLNGRVLQFAKKEFDNKESLIKLRAKGFEHVFLTPEGYSEYINKRKEEKKWIESSESRMQSEILQEFVTNKNLIRQVFTDFGLNQDKVAVIQELNHKNINFLKQTKNLQDIFELFSQLPETSVVKKQMETFFCVQMLESVPEFKSGNYGEKVSLAIMISDVLLSETEYWDSFNLPKDKLSSTIKNHPHLIASKIGEGVLPPNVICMIKQHHEKPDGTGYPEALNCQTINVFAAFYIIAEDFVSQLIKVKMKSNEVQNCADQINLKYNKYLNCPFEKALNSFNKIMKNDKLYMGLNKNIQGGKNVA